MLSLYAFKSDTSQATYEFASSIFFRERSEVSTLTEDGHSLSGFGATVQQAIEDAHEKAQSYGDYDFPTYRTSSNGDGGDAV